MEIIKSLKKQYKDQKSIVEKLKKREKEFREVPEGSLRIKKKHGGFQYYFKGKDDTDYRYVPVSKAKIVKGIVQRDYEKKLLDNLIKANAAMESFFGSYQNRIGEKVYSGLCEGRKKLVEPQTMTDDLYIERWYRDHPGGKNHYPDSGKYITDREEIVRSKSEKILADLFYKRGIPYVYEPEIRLNNGSKLYPDFVVLNVQNRKTYIWEHLGLISDGDYASKNLKKIFQYEKNNYLLGESLLISEESDDMPLDLNMINLKLDKYLVSAFDEA